MAKPDIQKVNADVTKDTVYVQAGKESLNVKALKAGSGTLDTGTVTISDADALSTSKILVTNTNSENELAVTTKSNGSFVVDGTGADTFDYLIINL